MTRLFNAHLNLLRIRGKDLREYYKAYDACSEDEQAYHDKRERAARRKRVAHCPNPGNSETIMRNRVRRAKSFGLEHDGLFNSPVNRG